MNAQELTRLRQKSAVLSIHGPTPVDASLQTWRVQCRAVAGASATPAIVGNQVSLGSNVLTTCAAGKGTNGDYSSVLLKNAGATLSNNPTPETNPYTLSLPCFTYETRQRYALSNAAGVIVDSNTFLPSIGRSCSDCKGERYNDNGIPINSANASVSLYGGGLAAAITVSKTGMRMKFPSA